MPDNEIDVRKGGTVTGTTFTWKNAHEKKTTAQNFTPALLTASSYPVPGSANGKDGELSATVNPGASGDCNYTWGDEDTLTTGTGTLKINTSMPKSGS